MSYQSDLNAGWKFGPQTVILIIFLLALTTFGTFQIRKWLLPAEEALRRDVYEESKSYIDGTIRDLENLMVQYGAVGDAVGRATIANIARQRSVDFPEDRLPAHLVEWLASIR